MMAALVIVQHVALWTLARIQTAGSREYLTA
jgi:hypothetical protein